MIRKKDELGGILAFEDHLIVLGSRPVNIRVVIVTGSVGKVLGSLWIGKWKWSIPSPCWRGNAYLMELCLQNENTNDMNNQYFLVGYELNLELRNSKNSEFYSVPKFLSS